MKVKRKMKIHDLAVEQNVYSTLRDILIEDEYYNTMDEGWTTEETFEAKIFLEMTESEKKVYALSHASQLTDTLMDSSVEEFVRQFGDYYDDIITL